MFKVLVTTWVGGYDSAKKWVNVILLEFPNRDDALLAVERIKKGPTARVLNLYQEATPLF